MYVTIFKVDPNEYDLEIVKEAFKTINQRDKTFKYGITPNGTVVIFSKTEELAKKRGEWVKRTVLPEAEYKIKRLWR